MCATCAPAPLPSRKPSALSSPCTPSPNGGPCCITELAILNPGKAAFHTVQTQFVSKPILFWGRTREELNHMILIEPIQGWEGQGIRSYGNVVMSSLAVMQISHTEESTECFMVLFPLHLLILSMDHKERIFIYQGLLPLSGMNVVCERYNSGYTFEVSGPMIEPRQVSCLSSSERSQWISALQKHIQEANAHYPPVSPTISILSYLIPCDQLWKKRGLIRYLTSCPIQKWEGKAIHHMGHVIFLSAVQTAHTMDGEFEDRILVLFPEDLVFLSVDANKTSVIHQGTLPLNAIHIEESLTWNRPLEFQITGDLMDPILIVCMTPEDYTKWIFHLQKPHHMPCGVTLHPLPSVPAKYRR
ncbi:probable pleckstrin homology domain-containing family N member 1 isoform X2 [Hyla sarda]|uniref:probable pleckstrin homology domain-containing family N member 1 isoform X2 n=1 Tax=Hyla sarda TaxID=327740 RepID=UPI0024C3F317|nr:probable pleckstrin homology domain-containing family N member 1 isoform X2 [Hyla sarda]